MTADQSENPDPLPPSGSLCGHRWIRLELTRLYRQGKAGRIDSALLGRLVHLLSVLGGIIRDTEFEARLAALEEQAAEADLDWPAATNGAGRHVSTH